MITNGVVFRGRRFGWTARPLLRLATRHERAVAESRRRALREHHGAVGADHERCDRGWRVVRRHRQRWRSRSLRDHDAAWQRRREAFSRRDRDLFSAQAVGLDGREVVRLQRRWPTRSVRDRHAPTCSRISRRGTRRAKRETRMCSPCPRRSSRPGRLGSCSGTRSSRSATCRREVPCGRIRKCRTAFGAEMDWPWGSSVGDMNADGWDDVFITAGMNFPFRYAPSSLLLNDVGRRFVASEFELGVSRVNVSRAIRSGHVGLQRR